MQSKYLGNEGSMGKKEIEEEIGDRGGASFLTWFCVVSHLRVVRRTSWPIGILRVPRAPSSRPLVLQHRNLLLLSANFLLESKPLVVLRLRLRQLGL
jgi:hypothetical protein